MKNFILLLLLTLLASEHPIIIKAMDSETNTSANPHLKENPEKSEKNTKESLINNECTKLFIIGFVERFLFYYSCDLRTNCSLQDAFIHCLAGGLISVGASRLGSMPKLSINNWTKSEILKHTIMLIGVQVVTRLICMMQLASDCSYEELQETIIPRLLAQYDIATYALLVMIPLLKRHYLGKKVRKKTKLLANHMVLQ